MGFNNIAKEKAVIIVSVENVFNEVKNLFKNEIPKNWFDNNEVDEIIIRIFNIIISNILKTIEFKNTKNYDDCYQGNLDYLEYCGLSQKTSFQIVHLSEMLLIRSIFETYPILDNTNLITVFDYKLINLKDLLITVIFNNQDNNYATTNNYSNYKNTGIV